MYKQIMMLTEEGRKRIKAAWPVLGPLVSELEAISGERMLPEEALAEGAEGITALIEMAREERARTQERERMNKAVEDWCSNPANADRQA